MQSNELRDSAARVEFLKQSLGLVGEASTTVRGGRVAALRKLETIQPAKYAKTRNAIDGAVTGLSPYIRHRVLTLAEVRDSAIERVNEPWQAQKLIQELAWHDFFQRVYAVVGEKGVWTSLEPWNTGLGPSDYANDLPPEIEAGETGVDWVDYFAKQLADEGWLHNHARMWLACYVVHVRRVSWQAGARWFLRHLVDGDPASNNLSWQWVASTFAARPYFMNRENVANNSGGRFPRRAKNDPLDKPYPQLQRELFPQGTDATQDAGDGLEIDLRKATAKPTPPATAPDDAVVWVHHDMLNPGHPALTDGRPALYVFDPTRVTGMKPIAFVAECLSELPAVSVRVSDDVADAVRDFAGGRPIVTGETPAEHLRDVINTLDLTVIPTPPFATVEGKLDLKRFSRYWRMVQKTVSART